MTVSQLIQGYKQNNPDGNYFDESTLQFFGEKVSEMMIVPLENDVIDGHKVVCLRAISHNAPPEATVHYTFFDKDTFEEVMPAWRGAL